MRLTFDPRPVLMLLGYLILGIAAFMIAPLLVDYISGDRGWPAFFESAVFAGFFGVMLLLSTRGPIVSLSTRQAILLTVTSWMIAPAIGAMPLLIAMPGLGVTNAYFEAMSAMTTTGSTVLSGLEDLPAGVLLWRALLQWIGGIGIIVMGIALLPLMRAGGIRLFHLESSERAERVLPRFRNFVVLMLLVYSSLSITCAAGYIFAGMNVFDAVCHAMTTLSTGGFANYDASFGAFANPYAEWIAVLFMTAGSIPFFLYIGALGGGYRRITENTQVRVLVFFLAAVTLVVAMWLWVADGVPMLRALRLAAFNVTSIVTTTGYASTDYTTWGALPVGLFFFLTFVGGCTGSTAGGIKILRFQIIWYEMRNTLRTLLSPHAVRRPVPHAPSSEPGAAITSLLFACVFLLTTSTVAVSLELLGLDLITAVTAAATAVANVGPGLGAMIGPAGNFAPLPDAAKWVLAVAMLLGRLELFAVFVLFTRQFWRF